MEEAMASTNTNSEVTDLVTFGSYNSTGMDVAKANWIKDMISECSFDFFAVQEHFKNTKSTDQYFKDNFSDHYSNVIPAHRAPGQLRGRCAGGLVQSSRLRHWTPRLDSKESSIVETTVPVTLRSS
jgi:hypothetical protein